MLSAVEELFKRTIRERYVVGPVIGEGGMATVFRAEDVRHHRFVALKLLKPELGALLGAERFLSEIQVTANLQHPHLLPLFDSGEADGMLFYVMPLVEGESLRARLDREKQLPVAEAVRIAIAVAGALDYAHRHGVVHRDLKPENILLHDGEPLVADFGIALAVTRAGGERLTGTGITLGTPQYMSPEQASAERTIDGRADIYTLGVVLYEMLAGEPPHTGSTMQAVIARVLTEEPRSVRATRASIPQRVADALERALAKLPADRFDTAHQFAEALSAGAADIVSGAHAPHASSTADARRRSPMLLAATALAIMALSVAGTRLWWSRDAAGGAVVARLVVKALPDAVEPASISADGRYLVYIGMSQGKRMIFVRPIDDFKAQSITGTEDAVHPFVSPDGRWIGYFATDDKLRKVLLQSGTPTLVAPAFRLGIGSWGGGSDPVIVTDMARIGALSWVHASGGEMHPLTALDTSRHETSHFAPLVLPDGRSVVFCVESEGRGNLSKIDELAIVTVSDIEHGAAKHVPLGIKGHFAIGVVDGWLVYVGEDEKSLMAARLDVGRRRVDGAPVLVMEDSGGVVDGHLSRNGTLVYSHRSTTDNAVMLVDATSGVPKPLLESMDHGDYMNPRLSPDRRRLLVQGTTPQGDVIWMYDMTTHTSTRMTSAGTASSPAWTSDGNAILYVSTSASGNSMMWRRADESAPAVTLFREPELMGATTTTPDGRTLVFQRELRHVWSIWQWETSGGHRMLPVVDDRFDNYMPALSPDGHWLAYVSTASGAHEIYVRPWPGNGQPAQVSERGGTEPVWSVDGRRLFYRNGNEMLAATLDAGPALSIRARTPLFSRTFDGSMAHANFVPLDDGHFIMIGAAAGAEPDMVVVINWLSELRRRLGVPAT